MNFFRLSPALVSLASSLLWLSTAQAQPALTVTDIERIIAQASTRALTVNSSSVVAVTDREGYVLGVWNMIGTNPAPAVLDGLVADAITKACTAAFLSSDQHAFSSRTAGFIVQQHFPPGVRNKPPGPLVGVNFSNLSFSDVNRLKDPAGYNPSITNGINGGPISTPITGGLDGIPGGLPLYKAGHLVGGVGVSGDGHVPTDITPKIIARSDIDEDIALAGQTGFKPASKILGSHVTVAGIRLSYTFSRTRLKTVLAFGSFGMVHPSFPITAGPGPISYPPLSLGGTTGELRISIIDDPSGVALPGGTMRLIAADVTNIIAAAATRARTTRAGIRLPRGQPAQTFISVVNNPNDPDTPPIILGSYCTSPDTTRFSWDVSVQKARTAVFFSSSNRAFSSRTVGFLAQSTYPPGIDHTAPGLFFTLQERFSIITPISMIATNPVNGAVFMTSTSPNPNLPNGMTIFPGGFPLYREGVLVGAIGVSGDGVDQDDLISASGGSLFPAPEAIRADQQQYQGARLPYAKFPRNPEL